MLYVACVYAASCTQLWNALPDWLQKLYCRFERWWNNSTFNAFNWAIGWGLVFFISTHFDLSTQNTRYGVSIVWALPTFLVHRKYIWGDRRQGFKVGVKWWIYWGLSVILNIGVNYAVVQTSGLPFLVVCAILLPYTTLLPYFIRDKWIFKQPKTATG